MEGNSSEQSTNNVAFIHKDYPVFKFVILGDSGCGKTSILHYFLFSKCIF